MKEEVQKKIEEIKARQNNTRANYLRMQGTVEALKWVLSKMNEEEKSDSNA